MLIVRPIAMSDLPALLALAGRTGVGMTTLPSSEEPLRKRVEASLASFAGTAAKADEIYMFVLDDTAAGKIAGTAAIVAAVGMRQAFYSYRVGLTVHASEELGIFTKTPTLFLSNDHTGNSELCSLFLDAAYRGGPNGALLSKSRFLFMANFREHFAAKTIAELRGLSDEAGRSPFWDGVGRHFFSMEFSRADYLTGIGKKAFVAELMPKHPLYSSLLSSEAQAAIGAVHPLTRGAENLLKEEGFRYENHVDIFDGGPTYECDTDAIGAVAASRVLPAVIGGAPAGDTKLPMVLMSNTRFGDFRVVCQPALIEGDKVVLDEASAIALGVRVGDPVRAVVLSVPARQK